jgi:hypothetical protein
VAGSQRAVVQEGNHSDHSGGKSSVSVGHPSAFRAIDHSTEEHTYGSILLLDDSSSASTFPESGSKRGRLSGGSPTSPRGLVLPKGQDCFAGGENRSATGRREGRSIGDWRLRDICSTGDGTEPSRRLGSGALVTRDSMRAEALPVPETSSDPSGEYGLLSITSSGLPPAAYPF